MRSPGLAARFGSLSGDDIDKFAGIETLEDEYGVPLLTACPHRMTLDRIALLDDGGDHVCLAARVRTASDAGPFTPLRVSAAGDLVPGHAPEERSIEP